MCASSVVIPQPSGNADPIYLQSDPSPFSLSAEQQAIFSGWQRPGEILPPLADGDTAGRSAAAVATIDLAQDLATDCSVVASLCAAVRHFRPTKGSVGSVVSAPKMIIPLTLPTAAASVLNVSV
jgi:hypothetical protein